MSRRSSFGYSSYGSRSYRSGGYGKRGRNNRKKVFLIVTLIILLLAAAGFACYYFLVLNRHDNASGGKEESSTADRSDVSEKASEVSAVSLVSIPSGTDEGATTESTPEQSTENPDLTGYRDGNVFMYDQKGYEMFYGTDESAAAYAAVVSDFKKAVGKDVKVYNLVAPNHSAFGLPEKYLAGMNNEKANIETIYRSYTEDVIPVNVYEAEEKHKSEYTYFKTDHNWTGLGAYYAYLEFCKSAQLSGVSLTSLSKGNITGFKGSLFAATKTEENPKGNKELAGNPDTVIYYNMPGIESCILLENGKSEEQEVSLIASFAEGSNAYSAFIWGNNPYMKVKTDKKTGRKLCIIKDSYGCAFAPFTTANFDEVYIVDPAFYNDNVIQDIKKGKFTDVLIINSIMNANTQFRVEDLRSIMK